MKYVMPKERFREKNLALYLGSMQLMSNQNHKIFPWVVLADKITVRKKRPFYPPNQVLNENHNNDHELGKTKENNT